MCLTEISVFSPPQPPLSSTLTAVFQSNKATCLKGMKQYYRLSAPSFPLLHLQKESHWSHFFILSIDFQWPHDWLPRVEGHHLCKLVQLVFWGISCEENLNEADLWCFSAAQQLCPIVSLSGRHITGEHTANAGEGDADEEDDQLLARWFYKGKVDTEKEVYADDKHNCHCLAGYGGLGAIMLRRQIKMENKWLGSQLFLIMHP